MDRTNLLIRPSLAVLAVGAALACSALGAPAFATDAVPEMAPISETAVGDGWVTDPDTGERLYYLDGKPADCVFVTDPDTGKRYWFEQGSYVREHAFFDSATNEWYWADADGTIAHGKDVFIPKDESDRDAGGKWVRIDDDYTMVKGEDLRYGGWYYFDPVTGEMAKGFRFVPSNGGKWVFYDYTTGQMAHGERYIDDSHGDEPGWMYFDDTTGAVAYGWKNLTTADGTAKTVYYDTVTGRMVYGWRDIDGVTCLFDRNTGEAIIHQDITWIGTQKYTPGREGRDWERLVIHTTLIDTIEGVDEVFGDANGRAASAHYCVDGTRIHQYVRLEDTAWGVGSWNWNTRTVSIEHVGTHEHPATYETLDTSAKLMATLAHKKGWSQLVMGQNVDVHKSFTATDCPFELDVDWLVARANHYLSLGR